MAGIKIEEGDSMEVSLAIFRNIYTDKYFNNLSNQAELAESENLKQLISYLDSDYLELSDKEKITNIIQLQQQIFKQNIMNITLETTAVACTYSSQINEFYRQLATIKGTMDTQKSIIEIDEESIRLLEELMRGNKQSFADFGATAEQIDTSTSTITYQIELRKSRIKYTKKSIKDLIADGKEVSKNLDQVCNQYQEQMQEISSRAVDLGEEYNFLFAIEFIEQDPDCNLEIREIPPRPTP